MNPKDHSAAEPLSRTDHRHRVVEVLEYIYGPLLVSLGFSYFFAFSDPAQEVILGLLTEINDFWGNIRAPRSIDFYVRVGTSIWLLGIIASMLGNAARWTLRHYAYTRMVQANEPWTKLRDYRREALYAFGAVALPLILFIPLGLWRASASTEAEGLQVGGAITLSVGILWPLWYFYRTFQQSRKEDTQQSTSWDGNGENPEIAYGIGRTERIFQTLFWLGLAYVGFFDPHVAAMLGPIAVSAGFAIALGVGLSMLTRLSKYMPARVPLLMVVAALAFATSGGLTAWIVAALAGGLFALSLVPPKSINHTTGFYQLRLWPRIKAYYAWFLDRWAPSVALALVAALSVVFGLSGKKLDECGALSGCNIMRGEASTTDKVAKIEDAYAKWVADKKPVMRIVAAQGGGLYAAYHTALYLAVRADNEPDFAQSVFAISGVSGGSVGAGIYWAIRTSGLCDRDEAGQLPEPDCHANAVHKILKRDYLSPALAAFFFRDFADTFVPYTAMMHHPVDRGYILEQEFVRAFQAWETPRREDIVAGSFLPGVAEQPGLETALSAAWAPELGAPLLFFNGTAVGDGAKHTLSPLEALNGDEARLSLPEDKDLTVVNAMVISARFPVVSPPARVQANLPGGTGAPELLQLVDGGYFDNSGVETVTDIIKAITPQRIDVELAGGTPPDIEVIRFVVDAGPPEVGKIKGTMGAPLSAFTNAWRARIPLSAKRMGQLLDRKAEVCAARSIPKIANFTVSWFLAEETFRQISQDVSRGADVSRAQVKGALSQGLPDCPTGEELRAASPTAAQAAPQAAD